MLTTLSRYWGGLSDRLGRKPVLIMGCLGTIASLLVVGFSTNFWMALFGRFLGGALNGNIGVIQTMVGELVVNPKHERELHNCRVLVHIADCLQPRHMQSCHSFGPSEPSLGQASAGYFAVSGRELPGHLSQGRPLWPLPIPPTQPDLRCPHGDLHRRRVHLPGRDAPRYAAMATRAERCAAALPALPDRIQCHDDAGDRFLSRQ